MSPHGQTAQIGVHTFLFAVFLVALIATSPPRAIGDGGEYLAMALDMGAGSGPWLTNDDAARLRPALATVDGVRDWDPASVAHQSRDGTRDFVHFWFYPALAAPLVRAAAAAGMSPVHGFAALNVLLLTIAFCVAVPRIGPVLAWLLCAGPVLWWIDKPHTEVFTFSLLSLAALLLAESPGWAIAAAGVAATQNPPIFVVVPAALLAMALTRPALLRSAGVWAGVAGAAALLGAHMLYYALRHDTPFLLLGATRGVWPNLTELMVVPFDTNLGLFPTFPALTLLIVVAVLALVWRPQTWWTPDVLLSVIVLPVFLVSFTQTTNVHHGGTPGLSRYGVWLVPLAIPVLRAARSVSAGWLNRLAIALAIPSVIASALIFHPRHPDNYREPTALAQFLWTRYPSVTNPLPEIFGDVLTPGIEPTLPIATASCEKVLLVGRGEAQGMWPIPCYPAEVPLHCRTPEALCYANRTADGYRFSPTRDPAGPRFKFAGDRTWSRASEAVVRRILDELGWPTLRSPDADASMIVGSRGIELVRSLEASDRMFVVAVRTAGDAEIDVRRSARMSWRLIDPETDTETGQISFRGANAETLRVRLPAKRPFVILVVK